MEKGEAVLNHLKTQLFLDGAHKKDMLCWNQKKYIGGFTTNPSLMKKAGIQNYVAFAKEILKEIPQKPISFEVFADDLPSMKEQALKIQPWGPNVYVKIPVMNTQRVPTYDLISELCQEGLALNVTAILTLEQLKSVAQAMKSAKKGIVSIFAGRVADTGRNPLPLMQEALQELQSVNPNLQLLWASTRELWNIFQAHEIGCHIITVPPSILEKLKNLHKNLEDLSQETVRTFYKDAMDSGYHL